MIRLSLFFIVFVTLILGCSQKTPIAIISTDFNSFEISYANGWIGGFSFIVDSNKIYFAPRRDDKILYGILPDTILQLIDSAYIHIRDNKTIKSNDEGCIDCDVLAIEIVAKMDTIRIKQTGTLNEVFYPMIESLQDFIEFGKHDVIQASLRLKTKSIVFPPPPEIDVVKFTVP